jgi:hypothetical protein
MHVQGEVRELKEQLAHQEEARPSGMGEAGSERCGGISQQDSAGASLIDQLASSMHGNVAERINQQKALFEVQDANVRNRMLLERLTRELQVRAAGTACCVAPCGLLRGFGCCGAACMWLQPTCGCCRGTCVHAG